MIDREAVEVDSDEEEDDEDEEMDEEEESEENEEAEEPVAKGKKAKQQEQHGILKTPANKKEGLCFFKIIENHF